MAHQLAKDHSTSRWSRLNNRNTRIETLFLMLPVSLNMVQCARRSSTAYWSERSRGQCCSWCVGKQCSRNRSTGRSRRQSEPARDAAATQQMCTQSTPAAGVTARSADATGHWQAPAGALALRLQGQRGPGHCGVQSDCSILMRRTCSPCVRPRV